MASLTFRDSEICYDDFFRLVEQWKRANENLTRVVVALIGDYNRQDLAIWFALLQRKCVVVPISSRSTRQQLFLDISQPDFVIKNTEISAFSRNPVPSSVARKLYNSFLATNHSGVVIFSSGTTGAPKGMLIDADYFWRKFEHNAKQKAQDGTTAVFLGFDHFGGVNSWLSALILRKRVIFLEGETIDELCKNIEKFRIETLPVTPSLLNLLLVSGCIDIYDLSSLKLISYGAEAIAPEVLSVISGKLPNVIFKQTYGLSELGVPRTVSKSNTSAFFKILDDDYEVRIVEGKLEIKTTRRMVGYLNADDPFKPDGWFPTGDQVEVDPDGFYRVIGRASDVINVGGSKVMPLDVEAVILKHPHVKDVAVFGLKHPILGQVVACNILLKRSDHQLSTKELKSSLRSFFAERLERFQYPLDIRFVSEDKFYSFRGKKLRKPLG